MRADFAVFRHTVRIECVLAAEVEERLGESIARLNETRSARRFPLKREVVMIPVADVDRPKRFYGDLGWRLDVDDFHLIH